METRKEAAPAAEGEWSYQGRSPEQVGSSNKTVAMAFVIVMTFALGIGLAELLFWLHGLLK